MKNRNRKLILRQVSAKLELAQDLNLGQTSGWIKTIRTAINMSLSQLGKRANKTAQGVKALEEREKSGGITLQTLREIADALNMKLVYAIVPKDGTLKEMVDEQVANKAKTIINRTNTSMMLEDQGNHASRLAEALRDKKDELMNEMPKFIWD